MSTTMLSHCGERIYADENIFICDSRDVLPLDDLFDIGDFIRALRLKRKIKGAKQIKRTLSVDPNTLSRIERTSKFDTPTVERIAAGLGTSLAELLSTRDALRGMKLPATNSASDFSPEHRETHVQLEQILQQDQGKWKLGIIAAVHALALTVVPPGKGKDGTVTFDPFRDEIRPALTKERKPKKGAKGSSLP